MSNLFNEVSGINESVVPDTISTEDMIMTEAMYPDSLPYTKMMTRNISLPKGKPTGRGNLCFLYTSNINESISEMTNAANFKNGNMYKLYFFNPIYKGILHGRNYIKNNTTYRNTVYTLVQKKGKNIIPYKKMVIAENENRNMYFDLSLYLSIFDQYCKSLNIKRKVASFWAYFKSITQSPMTSHYENKFVLINLSRFPLTKDMKENLNNPLYLLYFTLFKYPDLISDLNLDFYFYAGNKCLKVNPSMYTKTLYLDVKVQMNRLYMSVPKDNFEKITDEKEIESAIIADDVSSELIGQNQSAGFTGETPTEKKEISKEESIEKRVEAKAKEATKKVETSTSNASLTDEEKKLVVKKTTEEEINKDKALLNDIYKESIAKQLPNIKSTASSARDEKLKKEQKDIVVDGIKIQDIEKMKLSNIPIPEKDVSHAVHTINKHMTEIKYDNIDKVYNKKVMRKDIVDAFLSLNNGSIPMYVRDIKVKDTSNELNYKETYTVLLEDANRKRHTITVDIPKIIDDQFVYLGGNKKVIKHQSFLYPVVKCSENMVQVVTNHNKMTIERVENRSLSSIERLKKLLASNSTFQNMFELGNIHAINTQYITTVEYDDISKVAIEFKHDKCRLFFDQASATKYAQQKRINIPENKLFLGVENGSTPIFIDYDTQRTDDNETIVSIILKHTNDEIRTAFYKVKIPKTLMFTKVKIMDKFIRVSTLLGFWVGLSTLLKFMKVDYRLEDNKKSYIVKEDENIIHFADCNLIYKETVPIALVMNGLKEINTSLFTIAEMDTEEPYMQVFLKVYGKRTIANSIMNFYEFAMDPITKEVCTDLGYPTDITNLVIYAVSLLADSQFVPEINAGIKRIRCTEIIPAILYDNLAKNYVEYRNSNGRKKYSIPKDIVIKNLLAVKTVEDYSTLNPVVEMEQRRAVSSKGFRGLNVDRSYTMEKRTFDPSMTGIISPSTSPDGNVGVSRTLCLEPEITSLRGYVKVTDKKDLNNLKDINVFSPGELSLPTAAMIDDPTRLGFCLRVAQTLINLFNSGDISLGSNY